MPQSTSLQIAIRTNNSRAADFAAGQQNLSLDYSWLLDNGTLINQGDLIFADKVTLAASTNLDLDLLGSLTDQALGTAINFVKVKGILVKADVANTQNFTLGGAASNPFVGPFGAGAHTVQIKPNGMVLFWAPDAAGWAPVAGTGDILRIANGAGTAVNFDIIIWGASA
jgi:hypothetical protein